MKQLCCFLLMLPAAVLCSACKSHAPVQQNQSAQQARPASVKTESESLDSHNLLTRDSKLSYNGYDIIRLNKRVKLEDVPGLVEVSYAVLKRDGKVLVTFDGAYHPAGNATEFGLFPMLGGEQKQLLVSQSVPRWGRYWIVDLSSRPRVLFDSFDYHVGREDFSVQDVDGDGAYEIWLEMTAFWGFLPLSMADSPLVAVVFKYDRATGKYLPANREFRDYLLRDIDEQIKRLDEERNKRELARCLDILLRYVYAGEEQAGWSWFDAAYNLPDKQEVKAKVRARLEGEPIYKYLYRDKGAR